MVIHEDYRLSVALLIHQGHYDQRSIGKPQCIYILVTGNNIVIKTWYEYIWFRYIVSSLALRCYLAYSFIRTYLGNIEVPNIRNRGEAIC